jgi:hypothetical protein
MPDDTYAFYREGDIYKLDLCSTSVSTDDTPYASFVVRVYDRSGTTWVELEVEELGQLYTRESLGSRPSIGLEPI